MNTALWIAQWLGGAAFLMAGVKKASQPKEKLAEQMAWVEDFGAGQVRNIGVLEVAGSLGLVLSWLLDIAPILTPLAGLGLTVTMIGGAVVHVRRNEIVPMVIVDLILGPLMAFVAIGRLGDL